MVLVCMEVTIMGGEKKRDQFKFCFQGKKVCLPEMAPLRDDKGFQQNLWVCFKKPPYYLLETI